MFRAGFHRDAVLGMGGLPVTIRTLDLGADKSDGTGLSLEAEQFAQIVTTEDAREGASAFLQKRQPVFKDR